MCRRSPSSTRTDTLFPYPDLFLLVILVDVDTADVLAVEAGLVGDRADDVARLDVVCAADRDAVGLHAGFRCAARPRCTGRTFQIGRATCRDRVCQVVSIAVVAVSLKKKNSICITTLSA